MKRVSDDNFLCDTGDILDNAVWELLKACNDCMPSEELQPKVINVIKAFGLINSYEEKTGEFVSDYQFDFGDALYDDILACAVRALKRKPLEQDKTFKSTYIWRMDIIGSLELDIEVAMARHNLMTCHPWEDGIEHICYSCKERCNYCSKAYITAYKKYLKEMGK